MFGMLPPDKRLCSDHFSRRRIYLGLVIEYQLIICSGVAQFALDFHTAHHFVFHALDIETIAIAVLFGAEHR